MARLATFVAGASLTMIVIACGGEEKPSSDVEMQPLEVAADPPSSTFQGMTTVSLIASRPAQIFYSLTGTDPLGEEGRIYHKPLMLEESTLVTFMAISDDGVWSEPVTELYSPTTPLVAPDPLPRSLAINPNSFFFTPEAGSSEPETAAFMLRSTGFETVHISRIFIAAQEGYGFYEDNIFTLGEELGELDLEPGAMKVLNVSYLPTQTLRGAALWIVSDEMSHTDGVMSVELWGRIRSF